MNTERTIIIDNRFTFDGEVKKYRSSKEQIQRNREEKLRQRETDERARNEAIRENGNSEQGI